MHSRKNVHARVYVNTYAADIVLPTLVDHTLQWHLNFPVGNAIITLQVWSCAFNLKARVKLHAPCIRIFAEVEPRYSRWTIVKSGTAQRNEQNPLTRVRGKILGKIEQLNNLRDFRLRRWRACSFQIPSFRRKFRKE